MKRKDMRTEFEGGIDDFNKLSVEELEQLTYLNLEKQNLDKFPDKVFLCKNLTNLKLEENNISVIPSSIEKLQNLNSLSLYANKINTIPSSIANLQKLEGLYLESNLLEDIPPFILKMKGLKELAIYDNPFQKSPVLSSLNSFGLFDSYGNADREITLRFLKYIIDLVPAKTTKNKKYFSLQIEKELQTPILHYLLFFKDYVKGSKKKDIHFEVERVGEDTLMLVTNGRNEVTTDEMRDYFEEYVDLTRTKMDDWVLNVDAKVSRAEGDILRLKLENEVGRFKNAYKIAQLENHRLKDELDFLRRLTLNFSEKPITLDLKLPAKSASFNPQQLLLDLRDKALRLMERKYSKKLEDLHNDEFTDFLRDKKYSISDQSRSGRSKLGTGEVDILVRSENGTPVSIIEAFRLDSCGPDNTIVGSHLDKLLHNYDTAGHPTNFVLVYAEAKKFLKLWENYLSYVNDLNVKPVYRNQYPLLSFKETGISQKADLKIGLARHERNGKIVEVYHLFLNMHID